MGQIIEQQFETNDGQKYKIRTMVKDDAEVILDLCLNHFLDERYSVTTKEEFNQTVEEEVQWIEIMYNNDNDLALVVEVNSNIVGILDFHQAKHKRRKHIGSLGTSLHTDFRERGIGTQMVKVLIEWAKDSSEIEKLTLDVLCSNERAAHVYKKCGFVQEGHFKGDLKYDDGRYVDDISMSLWVK